MHNSQLLAHLDESRSAPINIFKTMRCRNLHTNSRLSLGHHREAKSNNIDTALYSETKRIHLIHITSGNNCKYILSISSAKVLASLASPSITGAIGWSMPAIVNPARVIVSRKRCVFSCTLPGRSLLALRMSSTLMPTPTTAGGSEFENRYGRDF